MVADLVEALRQLERRHSEQGPLERHGFRSPAQARRDLTAPTPAIGLTTERESSSRRKGPARIPGRNHAGLWTAAGGSRIRMQGARRCPIRRPMAAWSVPGPPGPATSPRRPRRPLVPGADR
jgi:hypothetical protein